MDRASYFATLVTDATRALLPIGMIVFFWSSPALYTDERAPLYAHPPSPIVDTDVAASANGRSDAPPVVRGTLAVTPAFRACAEILGPCLMLGAKPFGVVTTMCAYHVPTTITRDALAKHSAILSMLDVIVRAKQRYHARGWPAWLYFVTVDQAPNLLFSANWVRLLPLLVIGSDAALEGLLSLYACAFFFRLPVASLLQFPAVMHVVAATLVFLRVPPGFIQSIFSRQKLATRKPQLRRGWWAGLRASLGRWLVNGVALLLVVFAPLLFALPVCALLSLVMIFVG